MSSGAKFEFNPRAKARLNRAMNQSLTLEKKSVESTLMRFMIMAIQSARKETKLPKKSMRRKVELNPKWEMERAKRKFMKLKLKDNPEQKYRIVVLEQGQPPRYLPKRNKKIAGDKRLLISRKGLAKNAWGAGLRRLGKSAPKKGGSRASGKRFARLIKRLKSARPAIIFKIGLSYINKINRGIERRAINKATSRILKTQEKKLAKKLQRKFK